ncbi:transcription factor bHLH52-like [Ipomoea triloba]|uniref:transcription factor bHLH52-like n=1 Tax=Ipomoea triloba TaxID=35885 RepID=UPI00125E4527|nr:transcription factor bHLH52-like [Ipomoea triloba]
MTSLSYCSNWEISHDDHYLNFSETLDASGLVMTSPPFFPRQQTLVDDDQLDAPPPPAEHLFGFNNRSFLLPESSSALFPFDPLFNSGEFIFSDNYVSPPQAAAAEYSFPQELEFQAHPKRQKLYHDNFAPEITHNCFGAALIPDFSLLQDLKPPAPPPSSSLARESLLPELPIPAYCDGGETEVAAKKNDNSGKCGVKTLSAQSIAARERRRRIAEKTQELGKLIPGGQKMNTAEMFQAGYNYIKFMQTQLSVLQSCHHSSQESGETYMSQELETLVGSVLIQEKLYSNDKCLVPQKFIQSLPNAHQLDQASPPSFDTKLNSDPIS